ncbi:type I restriction endonuclease subunit R, EcoR124 family [Roseiconus lacunae]|uniref:type I restriction endonuclease subunit R, EcoR124 family n=1 Tax=Roseiconus lacunae TaxID=2605694 RepID=UPI001F3D1B3C|nr:hypothetical protein [Roseiconus lacunae]
MLASRSDGTRNGLPRLQMFFKTPIPFLRSHPLSSFPSPFFVPIPFLRSHPLSSFTSPFFVHIPFLRSHPLSSFVDFINQADLDGLPDKASVIEAFFGFARAEQQREAGELITDENLNEEAAKRYISISLRREYASENGTELNAILPKMSPLNPQYLTKKQSVFQRISAFVDKFKGVGGDV